MKPPICVLCDKPLSDSDDGGLIYFKQTKADKEWKKKMETEGMVGHPPYAEWFCEMHYQEAIKLKEKSKAEALKILRKNL